jgi:hypothetical protein
MPPQGDALTALSASGGLIELSSIDHAGPSLKFPLDPLPGPDAIYGLQIHFCDDFVNVDTSGYGPVCRQLDTRCCGCRAELYYEPAGIKFADYRIHNICPTCSAQFRPQQQIVEIAIGATGGKYELPAGICYRFAVVIDCGKQSLGVSEGETPRDPRASAEFLGTCRDALGVELYDASCYS